MDMAYTKALKLMKNAEAALGFPLTTRITGGRDGGGSTLTPEGKAWLHRYEAYTKACEEANQQMFRTFFPKVGCVIMASGLGKRFGGNKLMADFRGEAMIIKALHASRSLKENRVVVTRHQDVAELCREHGVQVVLHDLPHRSDTVRLGLEALGDVDACLFLPADQPLLRPQTVEQLVAHWENNQQRMVRPSYEDTPGAPVVFPAWTFPQLRNLPEGKGGGWVMKQHPEWVENLPIDDQYELMDADTPQTLEMLQKHGE
jgi:molybdenum cofactor cytidylyltransferase